MARTTNFSDLTLNCVILIFQQLQNLEDQLNLARCCQILRDAFVYLNRCSFAEIIDNESKLKDLEAWRALLWMCGGNVKSVELFHDDEHPLQLLPLVCKYCTNLEAITLHNVTVSKSQPYLLRMPALKRLHLRNYKSTSKDLVKSLAVHVPHLKSLGLDSFERRELQELRHFKDLEELRLYDDILTASDFAAIVKPMRNLRILQLRNARKFLTTSSLKLLTERCQRLEKLSFFDSEAELSGVAQFSHLKYLQLSCPVTDELKTRLFKALARNCAVHLEYLVLHRRRWVNEEHSKYIAQLGALKLLVCKPRDDGCLHYLDQLSRLQWLSLQCSRQISEIALMSLVRNNERLRLLNICYCTGITDDFVIQLLNVLAKQNAMTGENRVLDVFAAATDIRRDIKERLPTECRADLLRMYFECNDGLYFDGHFYYDEPEFDR